MPTYTDKLLVMDAGRAKEIDPGDTIVVTTGLSSEQVAIIETASAPVANGEIRYVADVGFQFFNEGAVARLVTSADSTKLDALTYTEAAGGNPAVLSFGGKVESTSGGFKFPDGTTQTTAASGSASAAGGTGAVQFADGTSFAADASNLFWDDTNNRLGIGKNNPATALDVNGTVTATAVATTGLDGATVTIGGTTATSVTLGRSGQSVISAGNLKASDLDTNAAGALAVGGTTATSVSLGRTGQTLTLAGDVTDIHSSAAGIDILAHGVLELNSSNGNICIGCDTDNATTIYIAVNSNRTVQMGNGSGTTNVEVSTGAGHFRTDGASFSIDSTSASNVSVTGGNLTLSTITSGTLAASSAGALDVDAAGALSLNSSAAAINIGDDAVAQAINVGTGAAARTITIGNTTGATAVVLNVGSGKAKVGADEIATLTSAQELTSKTLGTGTTLAANLAAGTYKITGLGDPSSAQDAATKAYVDSVAQGLDVKASVRAATTTSGTMATSFANGSVIDGVTLATGDRILIKNQTGGSNAPQNGIYTVNASGQPTRATDMDAAAEFPGAFTFVEEGTSNADTGWVCTNNAPVTVGTTAITFTQFSGAGTYSAGTGLSLSGTSFSIDTGTTVDKTTAQTLTNKTLTSPQIADIDTSAAMTIGGTTATTITLGRSGQNVVLANTASVTGQLTHTVDDKHTLVAAPSAPAAGSAYAWYENLSGRALPAFRGPTGRPTYTQPSVFGNHVNHAHVGTSTVTQALGCWSFTANGTASRQGIATTGKLAASTRLRFTTTAATNAAGGIYTAQDNVFVSSTADLGGFFFYARVGWDLVASGARIFVGFSTATTAGIVTSEPSATVNSIGLGKDSGDTNYQLLRVNSAGTITRTDLGFAPATNDLIDVYLWAAPGSTTINAQIYDVTNTTTRLSATAYTDGPAASTLLRTHIMGGTGSGSAAVQFCYVTAYLETYL